jgi:hypothetical protein
MTALNEIKVSDITWSGRTRTALKNGGLTNKTLADLDRIKPEEFLSVNRLGRGSLQEISNKIADAKLRNASDRSKERELRMQARQENTETSNEVVTTPVTTKDNTSRIEVESDDVLVFANKHRSTIQALMNGEMVLTLRP